ncbi:hypothetical protein QBC33DRAFT_548719 [Phialemonium atrogriseum]|uniref:Carbohydrate-binding module family 19 domain-containing protein n=1 Tax=Phialemonium atrogriseum TaxID=1093897 RepID=A0AAJ0BVK2_9PEZI|nr:uncharacterized protein QBC33DRAFT_548719 [Phialemonium atrogriseum]KAK1763837.1 hypothetical protein QBC33DRAFT_548719 [Phialemonium atrogriseum]
MRFSIATLGAALLSVIAAAQNCTPGEYRCRSTIYPVLCDATGNWVILQACPDGTQCIEEGGGVYCG